jgi:hypothetical protein
MQRLMSDERKSEAESEINDSPDKYKMANLGRFNNIAYIRPGTRFRGSTKVKRTATVEGQEEIEEEIVIESDASGTRLYFSPMPGDKGHKYDKNMVFEVPCF